MVGQCSYGLKIVHHVAGNVFRFPGVIFNLLAQTSLSNFVNK